MKTASVTISAAVGCAAAVFLSLYFAPTIAASLPMTAAVLSMGAALFRRSRDPAPGERGNSLFFALFAAAAAAIFAHRFLDGLRDGGSISGTAAGYALGLVAAIAVLPFFYQSFSLYSEKDVRSAEAEHLTAADYAALTAAAAVVITICSKSSPIYPFNDWADSNCYFTVGKALAHGKVLYRDIYEQKGILLYLLHTAAYAVSARSFLGVWLWEIAAAAAFLILSAKTLLLWAPRKVLALLLPVAAMTYTLPCFVFGDLAEEFCLPLLAYALYTGMRSFREDRTLSRGEWFRIGITSACVLWIKYSMVAFYLGWVLVPVYTVLRHRDGRALGQMIGYTAAGVLAVTVPVIAYFACHHALGDLYTGYFYNNIFLYYRSENTSLLVRSMRNLFDTFRGAAPMYGAVLFSLPWLLARKDRRSAAQVLMSMAALCLGIFNADQMHTYYAFILAVYMPLVCLPVLETAESWLPRIPKSVLRTAAAAAAAVIVLTNCSNFYMLEYRKEELPQYIFASVLDRYEHPSLLNYRFLDGGFYTVSGIVPEEKYFCLLNLSLPEMKEEQDRCVREGRADFIVTMDRDKEYPLYELVCEETFPRTGESHIYRLYIRRDASD